MSKMRNEQMTKAKKTTPTAATMEILSERRIAQERAIASLRDQHTRAVLAGEDFNSAPIRAAEDELSAIMSAEIALKELEQAQARQEAERQARLTNKEKRQHTVEQMLVLEASWLKDVEHIETSLRAAVQAYARAVETAQQLQAEIKKHGGSGLAFGRNAFEGRVGDGISAILTTQVTPGNWSFGQIKLPSTTRDPNLPWVEVEAAQVAEVERTAVMIASGGQEAA